MILASSAIEAVADDFLVYGVYNSLNMGDPGEQNTKDFYINMGSAHGVRVGQTLDALRKSPTYDLINEKLQRDVTFPIATLKVIHVEPNAAVARLEKMNPIENTPTIVPRAVMVGDLVRIKK